MPYERDSRSFSGVTRCPTKPSERIANDRVSDSAYRIVASHGSAEFFHVIGDNGFLLCLARDEAELERPLSELCRKIGG
jgi:hypothetical protein